MPGGGGYSSATELEVGAQRIAEAAHCILGSLGRMSGEHNWVNVYTTEAGHVDEENEIIQRAMKEYRQQLYVDQILDPTKNIKPQYRDSRRHYVAQSIKSILAASPKLEALAKKTLTRWQQQKDVPSDIHEVGIAAYETLIALARAMREAVAGYPDRVTNPYRDRKLVAATQKLDSAVKQYLKHAREVYKKYRPTVLKPDPVPSQGYSRPAPEQEPGESDIDYIMRLLR
jgi:hypothetical protein